MKYNKFRIIIINASGFLFGTSLSLNSKRSGARLERTSAAHRRLQKVPNNKTTCIYYLVGKKIKKSIVHRIIINWHIRLPDRTYTLLSSVVVAHYDSILCLVYVRSAIQKFDS